MLNPNADERLSEAVAEYEARQRREVHPLGWWNPNHTWHPAIIERRDCCYSVRPPSRAWPYSLLLHCRTAAHVAHLRGVSAADIIEQAHLRGVTYRKRLTAARSAKSERF